MNDTISKILNDQYQKEFKEYFEILTDVFDSLNVLHYKRLYDMKFSALNGKIQIVFDGQRFTVEMPVNNGQNKTHSMLSNIKLNIHTLKILRSTINDFKNGIKNQATQTEMKL